MTIAEILLLDFDAEIANTRRTLERVPEDGADWKPHEKSMPIGRLSVHVSTLPRFATTILTAPDLDLAVTKFPPMIFESREKLLADLEATSTEARHALQSATDEQLQSSWKVSWGAKVLAQGSRALLYRTMFLNHLVHHRAQLGVYLRLNNIPIPGLYGPSADE
jgi:uncharacterized damage-inducible protein DinB